MTYEQKNEAVASAKGLARLLSIDLSIKIFGVEILSYHFPPKTDEK